MDMLDIAGEVYFADYTSFESSFSAAFCRAVEYPLYEHMLGMYLAEEICKSFYTFNTMVFKGFRIRCFAKRMSGEVCTSLGNAWANYVVLTFLFKLKGLDYRKVPLAVEGDDSVFVLPKGVILTSSDFAQFGFNAKLERSPSVNLASFCGNIFSPVDLDLLVDPRRVLARFGYVDGKYVGAKSSTKLALLRAWGFSTYYQYHGCPIVASIAEYVLRVTRGVYINANIAQRFLKDRWVLQNENVPMSEARMYALYPRREIGMGSRGVIAQLYGIPYDLQIEVENVFNSLTKLQMVELPSFVEHHMTASQRDYFQNFRVCPGQNVDEVDPPPRLRLDTLIGMFNRNLRRIRTGDCSDVFQGIRSLYEKQW